MIDQKRKLVTDECRGGRTKHHIGGLARTDVFEARCDWEFFDGEDNLAVVLPGVSAGKMRIVDGNAEIAWADHGRIVFVNEEPNLRWKIYFDRNPGFTSYSLQFENWQDYDWYKQRPFPNPEDFIRDDGQLCVRQRGLNDDPAPGMTHERLKSIDGGYVVFRKGKQHNNYGMGICLCIHRPRMTDANGAVHWGNIDISAGLYTASFPKQVWDNAHYPVVINDTFGEDDESGFSAGAGLSDAVIMDIASPASDGDGVSMHMYGAKTGGAPHLASQGVYADDAPASLITNAETPASGNLGTTPTWHQTNFGTAPTFSSSSSYQVAFHMDGAITFYYIDAPGSGRGGYNTAQSPSDGNMPEGFTFTTYNRYIAVYCTYTPTASALSINQNDANPTVTDAATVQITPYLIDQNDANPNVQDSSDVQVTPYLLTVGDDNPDVQDYADVQTTALDLDVNAFDVNPDVTDAATVLFDKYLISQSDDNPDVSDAIGVLFDKFHIDQNDDNPEVTDAVALALDKFRVDQADDVDASDYADVSVALGTLSIDVYDTAPY